MTAGSVTDAIVLAAIEERQMTETIRVIFFDLGDTLGSAVLSPPPMHLVAFDAYPFVFQLLSDLRHQGLRLGIISNTGDDGRETVDAVLRAASIVDCFEPGLRLYSHDIGLTKDSPRIFTKAAELAGLAASPQRCLFVGEDSSERAFALSAGMRACPHPLLVGEVLASETLRYVRVTAPAAQVRRAHDLLRPHAFVPVHVADRNGRVVYGITSQRTAGELANMLLTVDLLGSPDAPNGSDLYLLRDDLAKRSGFVSSDGAARRF